MRSPPSRRGSCVRGVLSLFCFRVSVSCVVPGSDPGAPPPKLHRHGTFITQHCHEEKRKIVRQSSAPPTKANVENKEHTTPCAVQWQNPPVTQCKNCCLSKDTTLPCCRQAHRESIALATCPPLPPRRTSMLLKNQRCLQSVGIRV